jgi:hypothetical protein
MATTIVTKSGSGAPTASDLVAGELAVDLTNKRLYTEDSGGTVLELGTNPASDVTFGDNTKAIFGADSDLQIYSDGTTGQIAGNVNVTGSVTADGLTVDLADNAGALFQAPNDSSTTFLKFGDATSPDSGSISYDHFTDALRFKTINTTRMILASNGDMSLYEDTGTTPKFFWDASAERLGIGTNSPQALVDLSSATTSTLRLSNSDTVLTEGQITGQLEFYQADTTAEGTGISGKIGMRSVTTLGGSYYGNVADMAFYVSGQANGYASDNASLNAMTIQAGSGNVGIGTNSPDYTGFAETVLTVASTATNTQAMLEIVGDQSSSNSLVNGISFHNESSTATGKRIGQIWTERSDSDNDAGNLAFATSTVGGVLTEAMRIDSSGNVGIGTSLPASLMHLKVAGTGGTNVLSLENDSNKYDFRLTSADLVIRDGSSDRVTLDSSGRVGIGTSSPSVAMHSVGKVRAQKSGQSNAYVQLSADELTSNYAADIFLNDTGLTFKHNSNSRGFVFDQNGSEAMRIDASRNLLVGKTSTGIGTAGHQIQPNGVAQHVRDGGVILQLNRLTSDGEIVDFRKDGASVGTIVTSGGDLAIGTGNTKLRFNDADDAIYAGGGDGSGTNNGTDLGSALYNFGDLYLLGGVVFGDAGGSGTSSSNTLDSYEEGTFTPTVIGSTTAGTATYSHQNGAYTKIGNVVNIQIYLNWSSGTGAGVLRFSNLPFTLYGTSGFYSSATIGEYSNIAGTAGHTLCAIGLPNTVDIQFAENDFSSAPTTTDYDAAGYIILSMTYIAA